MRELYTWYLRRDGIYLSSEMVNIIQKFFESGINYKNVEVTKLVEIVDTYFTIECKRTQGIWYSHVGRRLNGKNTALFNTVKTGLDVFKVEPGRFTDIKRQEIIAR